MCVCVCRVVTCVHACIRTYMCIRTCGRDVASLYPSCVKAWPNAQRRMPGGTITCACTYAVAVRVTGITFDAHSSEPCITAHA